MKLSQIDYFVLLSKYLTPFTILARFEVVGQQTSPCQQSAYILGSTNNKRWARHQAYVEYLMS